MNQTSTLDLDALWKDSLEHVVSAVSSPAQRQWLNATHPVGFSDDTVVLATPHAFAREWLDTRCGERITEALSQAAGRELTVVITVQPNPEPEPDTVTASDEGGVAATPQHEGSSPEEEDGQVATADEDGEAAEDRVPLEAPGRPPGPTVELPPQRPVSDEVEPDTQLNSKYSFDDFVIGASNRFAHAAAAAVAEQPAKSYNPLFIYGGAGLGKTHLLHAIGNYIRSLYPRLRIRYVTTEQFTNEFINAIRDDRITTFQRLYRQADVLLMDDIQFLESKERTQEEFFHTFNALHNAEKQIVISSDRAPKQIAQLEDRLRSRFQWGLMTDIQPPDLETRIAILRKKSETDNLGVSPEVLEFIAAKVQSNIRELEGALIRISAFASLQQAPPDEAMAEMVLKDLFPEERGHEISVLLIREEVAYYFTLTLAALC
ncbi:MAG: chromosomal replication initiator protein DnaA [Nitriliruptorales bacterium]|nr:chromosomal replication initiator protein DnaA [Nitriliruptorales bacterium]